METYITSNRLFPKGVRHVLEQSPLVVVSGQPLNIFGNSGKNFYFLDCEYAIDLPLFVTTALMGGIARASHPHVPEVFTGEYPMISGFSLFNGDEYRFGIRPELGFELRLHDDPWGNLIN